MTVAALVGSVAGFITVISFVPQAIRVWRTRQTQDLSFSAFTLLATGSVLWLAYGILIREWPVILTNLSVLVLVLVILAAKLRFG